MQVETYSKRVESALPEGGKVNILQFTDKQYERIITFRGKAKQPANKTPDQFDLF
jgi:CRISPR-associated protein Cas2